MRAAGTPLYLAHVRALCFVESGHSFVRDVTCSTRVRSRCTRGCADDSNLALHRGLQRFFNFPRSVGRVIPPALPETASEIDAAIRSTRRLLRLASRLASRLAAASINPGMRGECRALTAAETRLD